MQEPLRSALLERLSEWLVLLGVPSPETTRSTPEKDANQLPKDSRNRTLESL
ncbi:hypothetical protein CpB0007 [Chlamydia pneumoniae TW-183]|uniref:Uncharacterized protein n=2 Tax=Chlamydia pneumoniae TaxID=83558 RepID=A0ABN3YP94_CHLPN|nr:hypothetical protein CPn_0006 [Chlamydia pneumoniae CWL029]AAP97940.1 hypothetical protein CpB0007 [Chlamydia pneumoniae TW-183]BAA98216.1 hypothetical protein [Chlamydia pneumoniae J138]